MIQKTARQQVVLLHGFASSSRGAKAEYLTRQFESAPEVGFEAFDFNPAAADFEFMTVTGLINRLRQRFLDRGWNQVNLVGSSLGGLVALNYAHRYGGVRKMLLLAPALQYHVGTGSEGELQRWKTEERASVFHHGFGRVVPLSYDFHLDGQRYLQPVPPAAPTLIIHGRQDEVVPIEDSRRYATAHALVQLMEVHADHTLNDQLPFIWQQVRTFLAS